jgi:hypothetical protein
MSDVTPNLPEESDEQALAEVDLTEFGITTDMTDENLELLQNVANEHLDVVIAAAEAAKNAAKNENASDPKSIARKRVNDVPADEHLNSVIGDVLESLFTVIDDNPALAAPALSGLGNVVKFVSDVRDVEIARVTAEVKAEQGVDPHTPDADDDLAFSRAVFKACRGVLTKLVGVCGILKRPIPETIKTEKNSNGDLVPVLRSLPKGRSAVNTGPNLGRGSKARRVRYTWIPTGGEALDLREGILLSEIAATIVSKGSYRILSDDLQSRFDTKNGGIDQFSETPWEIEFETGVLRGYLPKDS